MLVTRHPRPKPVQFHAGQQGERGRNDQNDAKRGNQRGSLGGVTRKNGDTQQQGGEHGCNRNQHQRQKHQVQQVDRADNRPDDPTQIPCLDGQPCPEAGQIQKHGDDAAGKNREEFSEHNLVPGDRRQQQRLQRAPFLLACAEVDRGIHHAHETKRDEKIRHHPANAVADNFTDFARPLFTQA